MTHLAFRKKIISSDVTHLSMTKSKWFRVLLSELSDKIFKRTLFIQKKEREREREANFRGNPLYQAAKQQLNDEKWDGELIKTLICFRLRGYVVFVSSDWKNVRRCYDREIRPRPMTLVWTGKGQLTKSSVTILCREQHSVTDSNLPRLNFSCAWSRLKEHDPQ